MITSSTFSISSTSIPICFIMEAILRGFMPLPRPGNISHPQELQPEPHFEACGLSMTKPLPYSLSIKSILNSSISSWISLLKNIFTPLLSETASSSFAVFSSVRPYCTPLQPFPASKTRNPWSFFFSFSSNSFNSAAAVSVISIICFPLFSSMFWVYINVLSIFYKHHPAQITSHRSHHLRSSYKNTTGSRYDRRLLSVRSYAKQHQHRSL